MTLPTTLDDNGFQIRGGPTRTDAFVDAAFAFAVTLLVISIGHVPASVEELVQALRGLPAFAASFFVISRLWLAHRHWSRRYGIEDDYATRLSVALVFIVLVYVYPLRMVAELTLASLSGGALAETPPVTLTTVAELRTLYVVFGVGYALAGAVFLLLHRHALARADVLALTREERVRTETISLRWTSVIAIALLSALGGLVLPMGRGETLPFDLAPGLIYVLLFVAFATLKRRERRRLAGAVAR
ncbi:MAG: TMEM175 family protein [Rhodanobacteraceae bacterium]